MNLYRSISLDGALDIVFSVQWVSKREDIEWEFIENWDETEVMTEHFHIHIPEMLFTETFIFAIKDEWIFNMDIEYKTIAKKLELSCCKCWPRLGSAGP